MKKSILAAIIFLVINSSYAISVSNFGSSTYTIIGGNFDTSGQTVNTLPLTGADNQNFGGDFVSGSQDLSSFVGVVDATVSGSTVDSGTSGTSGTSSATFNIVFIDGSFLEATYTGGTWIGLRDSGVTTLSFNTAAAGFDFTDVIGFDLRGQGFNGDPIDATLTDLSLVPEPSSFALLAGGFGLAWVMVRRRG